MNEKTYVRFIPEEEFVNGFDSQGPSSSVIGLRYAEKDGQKGYLVPCSVYHPDAEEEVKTHE